MSPFSPLPALAILVAALGTTALVMRFTGPAPAQGRQAGLDGLRGYLALGVFLHHGAIWHGFLRTGVWAAPPSRLYLQLGEGSVVLFFMITAFLFYARLLNAPDRTLDWGGLYVARGLRLVPLYLLAVGLLFLIVGIRSHGVRVEPIPRILKEVCKWVLFTGSGDPDINGVRGTARILAGVTWTLPYEGWFYAALPLFATFLRFKLPRRIRALGWFSLAVWLHWHPRFLPMLAFAGGILAAYLVRRPSWRTFAVRPAASVLICGCLAGVAFGTDTAYCPTSLLLLATAFALIAGGNTLFGLLDGALARTLGQQAYSLYLLHGLVLYVLFTFLLPHLTRLPLSPQGHWLAVLGATPVLILIAATTFHLVERPFMARR